MNYKYAIDNCLDDREFRNLVNTILINNGFTSLGIDDPCLSDTDETNNNDILVKKDNVKYTVQTFLNENIDITKIRETLEDMEKEKVIAAIIITNKKVSNEIKENAKQHNIEIWDRDKMLCSIENNN